MAYRPVNYSIETQPPLKVEYCSTGEHTVVDGVSPQVE